MTEFGKNLRAARISKGYTVGQLAEITRMAPSTIEELEAEDFSHIAAPIYGRGFVRLYCEAVGLDTRAYVSEFMDIITGNKDIGIKERPGASAPAPSAEQPPQDTALSAPPPPGPADAAVAPEAPGLFDPPAPEQPIPVKREPAVPPVPDSRYASPLRPRENPYGASFWRMGALVAAGILLLSLLGAGFVALYRATSPAAEEDFAAEAHDDPVAVRENAGTATDRTPAVRRQLQSVPALYVD